MPFFQNPFPEEFRGNWLLADRQHIPSFVCKSNAGRGPEAVFSWVLAPYNLTGNDASGNAKNVLTLSFALNSGSGTFTNWGDISVTLAGATATAILASEVCASLNADANFSSWFVASIVNEKDKITISQKQASSRMKFYVKNTGAETVLRFNAKAGVSELPTYFSRHTIDNRFAYADSQNALIELDPDDAVDAAVINNAVDAYGRPLGYDSTDPKEDWELLGGRSGLFNFQKLTVDGSDRITQIIEYPCGAKTGDLGRMIKYTYSGGNKNPSSICEIPYTLTDSDLLTP
jgi:archaellum component FlaG (FlaF/FlaG flagellin family)